MLNRLIRSYLGRLSGTIWETVARLLAALIVVVAPLVVIWLVLTLR